MEDMFVMYWLGLYLLMVSAGSSAVQFDQHSHSLWHTRASDGSSTEYQQALWVSVTIQPFIAV